MIDTHGELWRHQCEVRYCLTKGSEWFKEYIVGVAKARGKEAADRLRADVRRQHALGNRGEGDEWKDAA